METLSESKIKLTSKNTKFRRISFRFLLFMAIVINLLCISILTVYILINFRLADQRSSVPFIKLNEPDNNLLKGKLDGIQPFLTQLFSLSELSEPDTCSIPDNNKLDCNPEANANQKTCEARGCCWVPGSAIIAPGSNGAGVPACFFPSNYQGYELVSAQYRVNGALIQLKRRMPSGFPEDIERVNVELDGLDNERLRIRVVDADNKRYEVPMPFFNLSKIDEIDAPLYMIELTEGTILKVKRASTGTEIINTDLARLIFSNQFIQFSSIVPSQDLYGLGEHKDNFRKVFNKWMRYTFFSRDILPIEDANLYGSYGVYMMIESDGNAHGMWLMNSNAMDVIMQPTPALTWRPIGGILDFFVYLGPTVKDVARQYVNLVGRPAMQPWWSYGLHLSKYGYNGLTATREALTRNLDIGIPIEAQWNDIDYMDRYNDFTVDPVNYAGLAEYVDWLHSRGMHYVVILDPGVSGSEKPGTYPPLDEGLEMDIFIKNETGKPMVAKTWNLVCTAYPDFTNPRAQNYWTRQFVYLKNQLDIDGAWIDMNEPSSFHTGQIGGCPHNNYEDPPYVPGNPVPLQTNTICLSGSHHGYLHYDVHNIYGLLEGVATYNALVNITGKRPFVLSRSTFPSAGHFVAKWSGDLHSTWDFMKYSVSHMLEFNFYGIPMTGSDLCGFINSTNVEMCVRWTTLGAFYPFSRNHNDIDAIDQDPVALGPRVIAATKYAFNLRYRLIPFLYTLFYKAHAFGEQVIRPLFYEFPQDSHTYSIETQFMWGSSLLIIPILEPHVTSVDGYFPSAKWYDLVTFEIATNGIAQIKNLEIDDDKIAVYVRGGSIIPNYLTTALTMNQLKKQDLWLGIWLDKEGQASGELYSDDGESLNAIEAGDYTYSRFNANLSGVQCIVDNSNGDQGLRGIYIVGLEQQPSSVTLNEIELTINSFNETTNSFQFMLPDNFLITESFEIKFEYN